MITKAGELIDHVIAAVEQHGATPHTEIRVRMGTVGPEYRISGLKGVKEGNSFSLLLETEVVPVRY